MSVVLTVYSMIVGWLVYSLLERGRSIYGTMDLLFSWVLGLGVVGQVSFLLIVLCDGYVRPYFIFGHALFLSGLFFLVWRVLKGQGPRWRWDIPFGPFAIIAIPFGAALLWVMKFNINGGWDAWALWNLRANILFRGADQWQVFNHHWLANYHPYMQSYLVLFGWALDGQESVIVPMFLAFIVTLLLLAVIYAGLYKLTRSVWSVLGVFLLITTPVFLLHAPSQYADLMFALFISAAVIKIMLLFEFPDESHGWSAAALVGAMTFIKMEGLVVAGIILAFICYRSLKRKNIEYLKKFLIVTGAFSVMTIVHRIVLWGAGSPDLHEITFRGFFNIARWHFVLKFLWGYVSASGCSGHFLFLLMIGTVFFLLVRKRPLAWRFLAYFLTVYISAVLCVYMVVKIELRWYLWTTAWRIFFQLLPLMIVFVLYGILSPRVIGNTQPGSPKD